MKRYKCVVADPPWPSNWGRDWIINADIYDTDYEQMSLNQIASLPVDQITDPSGSYLWLWATQGYLRPAFEIAEAWGFQPKNVVTWRKPRTGLGYYFMINTEFLLFCRRGSLKPAGKRAFTEFEAPRRGHSVKPDEAFDFITRMSHAPFLEMFARKPRPGWDVWGDEVTSALCLCLEQPTWAEGTPCVRCGGGIRGLDIVARSIDALPLGA